MENFPRGRIMRGNPPAAEFNPRRRPKMSPAFSVPPRASANPGRRRKTEEMYKPNFCAECGERVARARWRPWTSRRFCAACGRRFRKRRVAARLMLCVTLFGLGFAFGSRGGGPPSPPLLVVERGGASVSPLSPDAARTPPGVVDEGSAPSTPRQETRYGPDGTSGERPTDPSEVVSMCGARTQKGTPCQRRVRGTGRCWQHRGRSAMLPPSKLVVPG